MRIGTPGNEKALVNIAKAGFFSSDRTIAEYNRISGIWADSPVCRRKVNGRLYDFFVKAS